MNSARLFVYFIAYEFRYHDHLSMRMCFAFEHFLITHELFMNNCLSKFELQKKQDFSKFHIFQRHDTEQLNSSTFH